MKASPDMVDRFLDQARHQPPSHHYGSILKLLNHVPVDANDRIDRAINGMCEFLPDLINGLDEGGRYSTSAPEAIKIMIRRLEQARASMVVEKAEAAE